MVRFSPRCNIRRERLGSLALGILACLILLLGLPTRAQASPVAIPFGVDVPSGFYSMGDVDAFQSMVGAPVNIVQNFVSWQYANSTTDNEFPYWRVRDVLAEGHTPEITWDPTINGDTSVDQPSMSLAAISDGTYDSYIEQFAQSAAAIGQPILLRFAHEMNGSWASYSELNSGNAPGDFVRAWQHVYDIFQQEGATNVAWIWSPNVVSAGDSSLAELYPGDQYVDWIGLDGYSYPQAGCETAQEIFTPALDEIRSFTQKPVMLAEFGVAAACADKPALITGLFNWLQNEPQIRSLTWWERSDSSGDDLVESTPASETAFQQGLLRWEASLGTIDQSGVASGGGDATGGVASGGGDATGGVASGGATTNGEPGSGNVPSAAPADAGTISTSSLANGSAASSSTGASAGAGSAPSSGSGTEHTGRKAVSSRRRRRERRGGSRARRRTDPRTHHRRRKVHTHG